MPAKACWSSRSSPGHLFLAVTIGEPKVRDAWTQLAHMLSGITRCVKGSPEGNVGNASGCEMRRSGKAGKRIGELVAIERLDQEAVHSRLETGVAIFHQRIRRQGE